MGGRLDVYTAIRSIECEARGVLAFYRALESVFKIPPARALDKPREVEKDLAKRGKSTKPEIEFSGVRVVRIVTYKSKRTVDLSWHVVRKRMVVCKVTVNFGEDGSYLAAGAVLGRLVWQRADVLVKVTTVDGRKQRFNTGDWAGLSGRLPIAVHPELLKAGSVRWRARHPEFAEVPRRFG
jgi:hypothetical protein